MHEPAQMVDATKPQLGNLKLASEARDTEQGSVPDRIRHECMSTPHRTNCATPVQTDVLPVQGIERRVLAHEVESYLARPTSASLAVEFWPSSTLGDFTSMCTIRWVCRKFRPHAMSSAMRCPRPSCPGVSLHRPADRDDGPVPDHSNLY